MNPPSELPMRVVGKREKSVWDRFAEVQRHGRHFRQKRQARIEVQQPNGSWVPYVGRKSTGAP